MNRPKFGNQKATILSRPEPCSRNTPGARALARFTVHWSGDVEFVWTHHSVRTLKRRERRAPVLFLSMNPLANKSNCIVPAKNSRIETLNRAIGAPSTVSARRNILQRAKAVPHVTITPDMQNKHHPLKENAHSAFGFRISAFDLRISAFDLLSAGRISAFGFEIKAKPPRLRGEKCFWLCRSIGEFAIPCHNQAGCAE